MAAAAANLADNHAAAAVPPLFRHHRPCTTPSTPSLHQKRRGHHVLPFTRSSSFAPPSPHSRRHHCSSSFAPPSLHLAPPRVLLPQPQTNHPAVPLAIIFSVAPPDRAVHHLFCSTAPSPSSRAERHREHTTAEPPHLHLLASTADLQPRRPTTASHQRLHLHLREPVPSPPVTVALHPYTSAHQIGKEDTPHLQSPSSRCQLHHHFCILVHHYRNMQQQRKRFTICTLRHYHEPALRSTSPERKTSPENGSSCRHCTLAAKV